MNNTVVLIGRLTAKPELRYTSSSKEVSNSNIAVKRGFGKETDFINFQVCGNIAKNFCEYCDKGSMIGIRGELRTEKYEDKDGNKRTNTYVLANSITFIETGKKEEQVDVYEEFGEMLD